MARAKKSVPEATKHEGQRSITPPEMLYRILPQWRNPEWVEADVWRRVVQQQPVAMVCQETLISNITALEYKIEPRDSSQRDELREEVIYYSNFLEHMGTYDYQYLIEWVLKDALQLPFGGAVELGWSNDTPPTENPSSRLLWVEPLDGGTLFPTLDTSWPVGQRLKGHFGREVYFPDYAIARIYLSPRTEISRKGWGCAPPERIYLALELLNRGDVYYANLLLDTPEVGILDLGDIDEQSAKEWIKSWQDLLRGVDPFKIPVLYEHEKPVNFVSFTRSPNELVFNDTVLRYSTLVASGYGMSLSDIGMPSTSSGGETLAGSIRQERRTRRTGFARLKSRTRRFMNRLLPPTLEFKFIDLDDELSIALGRARLATATAFSILVDKRVFSPQEVRLQLLADGLLSISVPEQLPDESEFEGVQEGSAERPGLLGRPISPSQGGYGEIRGKIFDALMEEDKEFREVIESIEEKWDEFDLNTKSAIIEELSSMLTPNQEKL